ncbi:MAG: DICT sensory domain-containing protein [Halanaerobium sp.]
MEELSLYKEIFEKVEGQVEELAANAAENKLRSFSLKFESEIPNLERMSYIMEKVLIENGEGAKVYAGFQKLSRAEAIWDRYHQMADKADKIYVFGENDFDLEPHPKIELVNLSATHVLTREWFLVIDKPAGKSMMVARDLDGFGKYENEKNRSFKGVKTNNPEDVARAVKLLKNLL